jgi:glucosamine-6-phosphate deaminase
MKIIIDKKENTAAAAAERYAELLTKKPDAVLGFTPGRSALPLYGELARRCAEGSLSFKNASAFCACEFEGIDHADARSVHGFMDKNLFSRTDIDRGSVFYPCSCAGQESGEVQKYDADIEKAGGMDLMVLGIGMDGSIGFNEPATPFESFTHSQLLTDSTRGHLASSFGSEDAVPERGVTMGIKTIMAARAVIMFACGEDKADIIHKMVYGKTVTFVPASMLQLHLDMTLYLDEAAASKLD